MTRSESIPWESVLKESFGAWLASDWLWKLGEARAVEPCPPLTLRRSFLLFCRLVSYLLPLHKREKKDDDVLVRNVNNFTVLSIRDMWRTLGCTRERKREWERVEMFARVDSTAGFFFAEKVNVELQRVVSIWGMKTFTKLTLLRYRMYICLCN